MRLFQRDKNTSVPDENYQMAKIEKDETKHRGNATGNIVNEGYATIQGEWIYYLATGD